MDYSGRLFRQGKASISAEVAGIFERLGMDGPGAGRTGWKSSAVIYCWAVSFAASSGQKLLEIGERPGVRHLVSLTGCPIL